jgi:hypothetical protein
MVSPVFHLFSYSSKLTERFGAGMMQEVRCGFFFSSFFGFRVFLFAFFPWV